MGLYGFTGITVVALGVLMLAPTTEEAFFGLSLPFPGIPFLSGGIKWNNLKVKYAPPFIGKYKIPLSTSKISSEFNRLQTHEDFSKVSLYAYKDDPRVQLMYDSHGDICGLRVAYVISDIEKRNPEGETFPYSYKDKSIFKKGNAMGIDFYYIDVLFIHPDVLETGGPATRKEAVGTGVYIKMDGKTWTEMPRNEKYAKDIKFTKQACFLGMGRHYFYDMTKDMKCEDHQPVFLLYHGGELVGLGLVPFGSFNQKFGRPWFESPPKWVIKAIVPRGPKCLAEWVGKYGAISLHIYFRAFNALNCVL